MKRNFVHDLIKIKYSDEGYLPYYPYHLISDEEMIDAFVKSDVNFFDDNYPCPGDDLVKEYSQLRSFVVTCCDNYLSTGADIPDWVYSYMLGVVTGPQSSQKDIHDLLVLLNLDNLYDEFNLSIYNSLYSVSVKALGQVSVRFRTTLLTNRPATMFGEPHIIKYLRLEQVSVRS